tara:strand:+ start:2590 stop:3216 length:627 start_codon:yes stop_codon:yes gene_type:complete
MGMTDIFIIPRYAKLVGDYINKNLLPESKIAWLGQQPPGNYSDMFDAINKKISVEGIEHHFYDIKECTAPGAHYFVQWDVHTPWDDILTGYELVLGIRIAYLIQSSSGLVKNLKYAVENNKAVMFDFNTGNLSNKGDKLFQTWKKESTNLIPHFPELYSKDMDFYVSDKDHLLTTGMLKRADLSFQNPITLQDPVKKRFYTLTEIVKA